MCQGKVRPHTSCCLVARIPFHPQSTIIAWSRSFVVTGLGIHGPNFELLDAKIASALNRIIHNTRFKKEKKSEGNESSQKEDPFLRGRQIVYLIYEYFRSLEPTILSRIMPICLNSNSKHPNSTHPKQQTPKQQTPKQHTPKQHTPKQHTPKQHTPKQHTPKQHTPKQHTPKQHVRESLCVTCC